MRFEDCTHGEVVLELGPTTLELFYWKSSEGVRLHLAMLDVEIRDPDRKGRREVRIQARPGLLGASIGLKVAPDDWPRVDAVLELVGPAQRALEPPVA